VRHSTMDVFSGSSLGGPRLRLEAVSDYLVFFVVDPVDDALAKEVRARVRAVAGSRGWRDNPPGFFDDPAPAPGSPRTTGGYLRVDEGAADGDDARAFCSAVQAFSSEFEIDLELQWREVVLGRVRSGVPDDGLEEGLAEVCGEG
jgi:hypothetical protein